MQDRIQKVYMNDFGFIITRHVISDITNKYWYHCIQLIRTHYHTHKIIIIDDNSNHDFVAPEHDYYNTIVIQSEYPNRGELLPFIYYLRYKWFTNAVIIHDSLFIHHKINFDKLNIPVLPFWHHKYDKHNLHNILRITQSLSNNRDILSIMTNNELIQSMSFISNYNLCFGCQCYINLHFLESLQKKYTLTNMISSVRCRQDRCALERIIGIIFTKECPMLNKKQSLFGNIFHFPKAFKYDYNAYINDLKHQNIVRPVIKVWSGR